MTKPRPYRASKSRIAGETGYLVVNKLVQPLSALLLLILIGRSSSELLGQYALVMTVFYVLQVLPILGLTQFVMREVARKPEQAGAFYTTIGALSLANCALINLGLAAFGRTEVYAPELMDAIRLIGWVIVPGILAFIAETILVSLRRAWSVAAVPALESALRVGASAWVIFTGGDIVALVWVLLVTRTLSLAVYFLVLTLTAGVIPELVPRLQVLREAFRVAPAFFVHSVLVMVIIRMDYIVLSLFVSDAEVGYYTIAYRVFEVPFMIATAFATAVFPTIARQFAYAPMRLRISARIIFMAALLGAAPLAMAGYALSDVYVALLFGNQYPDPVPLARLYALVLMVGIADFLLSSFLHATDKQRDDLACIAAGSSVYVGGLFLMVPQWGGYGAVIATAAALSVQLGLRLSRFRRHYGRIAEPGELLKGLSMAGAAVACTIALTAATSSVWLTALGLAVLICAYLAGLVAVGSLRPLRLLRFNWRGRTVRAETTIRGLLDRVVRDVRRHAVVLSRRCDCRKGYDNWSVWSVILYRLARFAHVRGHRHLGRLLWQANLMLTKLDISPEIEIGAGLVVPHPAGIVLSARMGRGVTFGPLAGAGRDGTRDAGAGQGIPVISDGAVFGPRAIILGGMVVPAGTHVPPHTFVHGRHTPPWLRVEE